MARKSEAETEKEEKKLNQKKRKCSVCFYPLYPNKNKCTTCGTWNLPGEGKGKDETILLRDVPEETFRGIPTGPWDACFSCYGGIVNVEVVLFGGSPGAGKSTASLQICDALSAYTHRESLYVGKEETASAIKVRANRLQLKNLDKIRVYPIESRADLGMIVEKYKPALLVVDSVPGVTTENEAVEMANILKSDFASKYRMPVIMIDHVNKEDELAGKLALQHAVDCTIKLTKLSDDPKDPFRYMMSEKNRFGPPEEVYLRMTVHGLIEEIQSEEEDD